MARADHGESIPMTPLDGEASELAALSGDIRHWGAAALAMLCARGTCSPCASPRAFGDESWTRRATHWSCSVKTPFGSATTTYSLGEAHGGRAATLMEVLHGLAEARSLLQSHPTAQDLINEGFFAGEDAQRQAQSMLAAHRKAAAQFERLAGPLADAEDPLDACRAAKELCSARPGLAQPGPGRPFGLAELAAVFGDAQLLSERIAAGDCDHGRAARLAALAGAMGHDEALAIAKALAERDELGAHVPARNSRAGSPRSL